uniref:Uncharacterized protein n=1 Tax=Parascaris equorum TaxID=6256 RepID=A0A914RNG7_PAREQ
MLWVFGGLRIYIRFNGFDFHSAEKVSTLESSVRRRHPFSPLSDDSPNTTVVGPDEISYIDGRRYEFSEGGIMRTPDASPSPWNASANSRRTKTKLPFVAFECC